MNSMLEASKLLDGHGELHQQESEMKTAPPSLVFSDMLSWLGVVFIHHYCVRSLAVALKPINPFEQYAPDAN
jgi:hypothetical protein